MDIRQGKRVTPERWETNEVIPTITYLDRVSRSWCRGGGTQVDPGRLWVEEMKLRIWGDQGTWVHRTESWKGANCTDTEPWLSAEVIPWVLSSVISACIWGWGKNHQKELEETVPCIHTGPGTVSIPAIQSRKSHNSQDTGLNTQKSLP